MAGTIVAGATCLQFAEAQSIANLDSLAENKSTLLPGIGLYNTAGPGGRALTIQPRLNLRATYTDNVDLSSTKKKSDFITETNPSISLVSYGAKVKGFFNYGINGVVYARDNSKNTIQRILSTAFTAEAIDNWLFVDVSGSITRQTISAFGVQTPDISRNNTNIAEVSNYRLSPFVRGRLSAFADYQLRYAESISYSNGNQFASKYRLTEYDGIISAANLVRQLDWSLRYNSKTVRNENSEDFYNQQLTGTLSYVFQRQLKISAIAGQEINNYLNDDKKKYNVYGYGFSWRPSLRSQLEGERVRRFFGEGHRLSFQHSISRVTWQFSDTKDVTVARGLLGNSGNTEALFDVLFSQFVSVEPDPSKRTQLVNTFIQANNLNPGALVSAGFLSSGVVLQRRQQISASYLKTRDIFTFLAFKTNSHNVSAFRIPNNDFLNTSIVRQQGYALQYSRSLNSQSNFNLIFSSQKTSGSYSDRISNLKSYSLNYNTRLGKKAVLLLGIRRTNFENITTPYNEMAVYSQLSVQF